MYFTIHILTDQEDRTHSIEQFRSLEKDVLVATDVASKGLDFPDIKHVINYDMPEDIENYGKIICTQASKRFWFLLPRRPAMAQASLQIRACLPEPLLFA